MPDTDLRKLTVEEREGYLKNYLKVLPLISDFTFSSLFMWADFYSLKLTEFRGQTCIICTGGDFTPSLLMPMGDIENGFKDLIDYYYNWFAERGLDLHISHVEERFIPLIESVEGYKFEISYNRDYSDYIYKRDDFISMNGSEYKAFRKKIRSFEHHFPNHSYSPLTENEIPECLELNELWRKQKGYDADSNETAILLQNYNSLSLKGGVVRFNGRVQAFLAGEAHGNTGYIIAGKADMKIHGLYLYTLREFVRNELPGIRYINRCEDLGLETLRDAKLSWMPVQILHKYNIKCTRI